MSEQNYPSRPSGDRQSRTRTRTHSGSRASSSSGGAPRRRSSKKKGGSRALRAIGTLLLIFVTTCAIMCCFGAVYIINVILPNADMDLDSFALNENSVMYYQDKDTGEYKELRQVLSVTSSEWVDYEDMPQYLKDAAVAIEDRRFWTHNGVDWWRTAQAVFSMFTGGDIQGGSTITQQLIKNLTDYNETTVKRKITEIFRALNVDAKYDKDVILELYLNVIPLGSGCEGVGAAAEKYFGKSASDLTLAECASLIAITNNPSKYGPYSTARVENSEGELWDGKQWNKYRQEVILGQMLKQEKITQAEYDEAVAQELVFVGTNSGDGQTDSDIYTWYEEQVITDVMNDLKEQTGYSDQYISQMLSSGGLKIYTCVDPEVQAKVEAVYEDPNTLNYTSKKSGQKLQSAITVIDNETGDIVALAGRLGEKTINRGYNLATNAQRQPGSSIKPLTVYAPAIEMGLISPITVVPDYPYQVMDGKAWPVNVDGVYRGQVTVRQALANSYNTVAVRVLADMVTPAGSFDFATQKFHLPLESGRVINGKVRSDIDVAPLSMGGLTDGVTTRDMANAFATFPSGGVYREARTYTRVEDSKGNVLLDNTRQEESVLKESTVYYMNSMLTSVVTEGGGGEAAISGMTVAGKTGTTDRKYDRWFVGYTPYYTAAVWVGYEINEYVSTSGINPAAQVWKKVMSPVHEGLSNKNFGTPDGLVSVTYCLDCGGSAIEACQYDPRGNRVASAYVFPEDRPSFSCTCHSLEEGSNSLVRVCVDDPILDENGEPSGYYHLAGPYCPEASIRSVCYLNLSRESVGGAWASDSKYFYSSLPALTTCTVHATDPGVPEEPGEGETGEPGEDPETGTDPDDPNAPTTDPEEPEQGGDHSNPTQPEDPAT